MHKYRGQSVHAYCLALYPIVQSFYYKKFDTFLYTLLYIKTKIKIIMLEKDLER